MINESVLLPEFKKVIPRSLRKIQWTLKPQTHQGANDSDFPSLNIWVKGDDFQSAIFLLGDLCTFDFEKNGWQLMIFSPEDK